MAALVLVAVVYGSAGHFTYHAFDAQQQSSKLPPDYRTAALGMALSSFVSLLVACMVWRSCHRTGSGEVAVNWHDLLRATHTGKHLAYKQYV